MAFFQEIHGDIFFKVKRIFSFKDDEPIQSKLEPLLKVHDILILKINYLVLKKERIF